MGSPPVVAKVKKTRSTEIGGAPAAHCRSTRSENAVAFSSDSVQVSLLASAGVVSPASTTVLASEESEHAGAAQTGTVPPVPPE